MPLIRFTDDPILPRDWINRPYKKGYEAEMTEDEAHRWLKRGVAIIVPAAGASLARAALGPGGRARPRAGDEDPTSSGSIGAGGSTSAGSDSSSSAGSGTTSGRAGV
jgi:hypothetical protein